MRLLPEGRVLEVDCEEGNFLSALDSRRYSVVGVERDESKAGVAKEMLRCSGIQGMVINTDLRGAALEPERFDLVALFGCLGRAGSPRALLMDVVRILKGGGTVAIETPVLSSLTARVMGGRWPPLKDRRNRFFFTQECLEKLLVSCGFQPGETRTTVPGGWPSPGNVFHVARKSAATLKAKGADDLARAVRGVSEDPAIGVVR